MPADLFSIQWLLPSLYIFVARIIDVALGTLRILAVARGQRRLAPILGFIEVFIWVTAVAQIVRDVQNWLGYLAYAAGFAVGNYVGMALEQRMAHGTMAVRIFVASGGEQLAGNLHAAGYGVTLLDGRGANGPVKVLFTMIPRWALPEVQQLIHDSHPQAFYSVEEVRTTAEGIFPRSRAQWQRLLGNGWRGGRK